MKKYEILEKKDFHHLMEKIGGHIIECEKKKLDFPKMNVTVKSYRKDKIPSQLKYYWVVITDLKAAFENVGYEFTKEELHEMMKIKHGFTNEKLLPNNDVVIITKSISDASEDVNIKNMMDLIDFIIRYAAINLDYAIKNPR